LLTKRSLKNSIIVFSRRAPLKDLEAYESHVLTEEDGAFARMSLISLASNLPAQNSPQFLPSPMTEERQAKMGAGEAGRRINASSQI
jgi:hypothetical protein